MKAVFLLVIASSLVSAFVLGGAVASQVELRRPRLTIGNALSVAQQYAKTHHIDVSQRYVDSARLDQPSWRPWETLDHYL